MGDTTALSSWITKILCIRTYVCAKDLCMYTHNTTNYIYTYVYAISHLQSKRMHCHFGARNTMSVLQFKNIDLIAF